MSHARALSLTAVLLALAASGALTQDTGIPWGTDLAKAQAEAGERAVLVYFFEAG